MSKFQILLLVFFGACIVIAVLVFSFSHRTVTNTAQVTVWGDISAYDFGTFLNDSGLMSDDNVNIQYVEKPADTFDVDFTEALAEGTGPDLVIIPHDKLWKEKNKLYQVPFSSISQKDFVSTFADVRELFTTSTGIYALPLTIDPLVLYFNRDLLSKASLAEPPGYWDQMYVYAEKLVEKDRAGNLTKPAISLGEASNIPHSKDILATLMLQAGTPITDFLNGSLQAELSNNFNLPIAPGEAALDFYTQFADPAKPYYTWNRSLLPAQTMFVSGDSALYLGFASELKELKAKNPTLNLGVTSIPQSRVAGKTLTFGRVRGVAIVKSSKNIPGAFDAMLALSSGKNIESLSKILGVPPARRGLLSNKPNDLFGRVFYDSAIQSRGWIDPNDIKTKKIFSDMIQSVTSGRARTIEALRTAEDQINSLK